LTLPGCQYLSFVSANFLILLLIPQVVDQEQDCDRFAFQVSFGQNASSNRILNRFMTGERSTELSIVAVGAHMDDCWLGMGGVALKAARAGHRVNMVHAVSQYGAWPVVAGREAEIKPAVKKLADDAGIRLIPLGHDYMRLQNSPELVGELAGVLDEPKPDRLTPFESGEF
jgi:hypothetical protein